MRKIMMAAAVATLAATPLAAQTQQGLVNVNVTDLEIIKNSLNNNNVQVAVPVNVQVPIGVAANVCGVSVLSIRQAGNKCDAKNASTALGAALAKQGIGERGKDK
jgi:hypothetical protein